MGIQCTDNQTSSLHQTTFSNRLRNFPIAVVIILHALPPIIQHFKHHISCFPHSCGVKQARAVFLPAPLAVLAHKRREGAAQMLLVSHYYRNNLLKVDLFSNLSVKKYQFQREELMILTCLSSSFIASM